MPLAITGLYAALIGLLAVVLGARVSITRAKTGISILHGDNMALAEKMRQHGNLTENALIAVVLMAIAELNGAGATLMHTMGLLLLVGRIAHPFGINHEKPNEPLRAVGAIGTTLPMLIAIVFLLWRYFGM